ncbi:TetR/AcrR family transcriptional regulator [Streptomyces sp. DG2A-72]|uniref:TetR/AcrR family transcriptional regulator n=1 Tax=Streptomyces sp. DG2A-72 TaxID=3051386 RepID=UPI00265C6EC5|nr:TetR/AcrR family transcriptional regulator [Streptomyces sp. DG2A-72]MDO0939366.1 TetR/AcrR family transcriptional regulator [Streptomyces sp. DG2A-72]
MVKQQRAARTREALVQAAAAAFDCVGYEAASLAQVSKSAGISMGALTFHFPTKEQLAAAVQARGACVTRTAVEKITTEQDRPLRSAIELTLEVARLLDEDVSVRAAARLTRECPNAAPSWTSVWLPAVGDLLDRASQDELRPGADPQTILTLTAHLITGTENYIRRCASAPEQRESAQDQLYRVWQVVLPGISQGPCPVI